MISLQIYVIGREKASDSILYSWNPDDTPLSCQGSIGTGRGVQWW